MFASSIKPLVDISSKKPTKFLELIPNCWRSKGDIFTFPSVSPNKPALLNFLNNCDSTLKLEAEAKLSKSPSCIVFSSTCFLILFKLKVRVSSVPNVLIFCKSRTLFSYNSKAYCCLVLLLSFWYKLSDSYLPCSLACLAVFSKFLTLKQQGKL